MNGQDAAPRSGQARVGSETCDECGANGSWGPCSELFMTLLALDHERRQPWGHYHSINVACYFLQHPSQARSTLSGHWQIVHTFLADGLDAVHALTTRARRRNNAKAAHHGPGVGDMPVPAPTRSPLTTIEDVAVDGTFPADGYPERMLRWAQATAQSRMSVT